MHIKEVCDRIIRLAKTIRGGNFESSGKITRDFITHLYEKHQLVYYNLLWLPSQLLLQKTGISTGLFVLADCSIA